MQLSDILAYPAGVIVRRDAWPAHWYVTTTHTGTDAVGFSYTVLVDGPGPLGLGANAHFGDTQTTSTIPLTDASAADWRVLHEPPILEAGTDPGDGVRLLSLDRLGGVRVVRLAWCPEEIPGYQRVSMYVPDRLVGPKPDKAPERQDAGSKDWRVTSKARTVIALQGDWVVVERPGYEPVVARVAHPNRLLDGWVLDRPFPGDDYPGHIRPEWIARHATTDEVAQAKMTAPEPEPAADHNRWISEHTVWDGRPYEPGDLVCLDSGSGHTMLTRLVSLQPVRQLMHTAMCWTTDPAWPHARSCWVTRHATPEEEAWFAELPDRV